MSDKKVRLGDVASVLRCQVSRKRLEWIEEDLAVGLLPDGRFICHEALARDVDARTGFLRVEPDNLVDLQLGRHIVEGGLTEFKFFLRENDILFTFGGTRATLCVVGLVTDDLPLYVIPGRPICIIRPEKIDAIWLFYYLRRERPRILRELATEKEKGKPEFLNLTAIRDVELWLPPQSEVNGINAAHRAILAETDTIRHAFEKVEGEQKKINSIFALSRRS